MLALTTQALEDKNAAVVAEAVEFLASVTKLSLLRRQSLLAVLSAQQVGQTSSRSATRVLSSLLFHF